MAKKFLRGEQLWLGIFALLGAGLVLVSTSRYGAGISPDSVGYLSVAQNFLDGKGLVTFEGLPLSYHPPLYPLLLALCARIFGTQPLALAHLLNAALYAAIVYLSGHLALRYVERSRLLAWLAAASFVIAQPVLDVAVWAWSEPLFLILLLLVLVCLQRYWERGDAGSLLLTALFVGLACLTRYVGVVVAGAVGVSILAFAPRGSKRIRDGCLFGVLALLPLGAWVLRNYLLTQTYFGFRAASASPLKENILRVLLTLTNWYTPSLANAALHRLFLAAVAVALAGGVLVLWLMSLRAREAGFPRISYLVLLSAAYVAFLVASATLTAYDPITSRLLVPLYFPLTLLIWMLLDRMARPLKARLGFARGELFLAIGMCVWMIWPLRATVSLVSTSFQEGAGQYNTRPWQESEIAQALRHWAFPSAAPVYTNDIYALYVLTGQRASFTPSKTYYNSDQKPYEMEALKGTWPPGATAWMVWFSQAQRPYLLTVEELGTVAEVGVVQQFNDGAIYRLAPAK